MVVGLEAEEEFRRTVVSGFNVVGHYVWVLGLISEILAEDGSTESKIANFESAVVKIKQKIPRFLVNGNNTKSRWIMLAL